jgi:hyperosmotically inducible periplasmic protein
MRFSTALMLAVTCAPAEASATSDTWITTRLKIDLVTASHVRARNVHVDSVDGAVTLYGIVDTVDQRRDAESVARTVEGVREVRNLLIVVPEPRPRLFAGADGRIENRVDRILKRDVSLRGSGIAVKSVRKGKVVLAGRAANLFDYARAVEQISAISAVRSVTSEIDCPNFLPNFDESMLFAGASNSALDAWITTKTKMRLLADPEVPALSVHVDTRRGVITLFGAVPTVAAKNAAVAHASVVDAVVGVQDELEVVPESATPLEEATDGTIQRYLETIFTSRGDLDEVRADVGNGVVYLMGGTTWQRLQAAIVARGIKGVRSVQDAMQDEPRG